jgi:hypothetical protein
MKSKLILLLGMMLLTSMFTVATADETPLAGPNYMGFAVTPKEVTVGDSFTTIVWVNVGSAIDTASVDNLTFLPAG